MILPIAITRQNINQLNGWNYENEKVYNTLNWKEKEALHILIIEQFKFYKKHERLGFDELVRLVKKNSSVIKISDELIDKTQMDLLVNEIKKMNKK